MPSSAVEKGTLIVSVGTLLLGVAGGIGAVYKFYEYDGQLAKLDAIKKDLDSRLAQGQLQRLETPILDVDPQLISEDPFSYRGRGRLRFVTFRVNLKNIGTAPVHFGSVRLRVEECTPDKDVMERLRSNNEIEMPKPVQAAPYVRPSPASEEESTQKEKKMPTEKAPEAQGQLFPVNPRDLSWTALPDLTKNLNLNYELQPGQKAFVDFDYLMDASKTPKWYHFIGTVKPSDKKGRPWQSREVEVVVDAGQFPPRPLGSSVNFRPVYGGSPGGAYYGAPEGAPIPPDTITPGP